MIGMSIRQEIILMQIRLFDILMEKMGLNREQCADLFKEYKIFEYIESMYELFHQQGDEYNAVEVEQYITAMKKKENVA